MVSNWTVTIHSCSRPPHFKPCSPCPPFPRHEGGISGSSTGVYLRRWKGGLCTGGGGGISHGVVGEGGRGGVYWIGWKRGVPMYKCSIYWWEGCPDLLKRWASTGVFDGSMGVSTGGSPMDTVTVQLG